METPNADIIFKALLPELEGNADISPSKQARSARSDVKLEVKGKKLYLHISADDIVMLRAALNTWLRLVMVAEEVGVINDSRMNTPPVSSRRKKSKPSNPSLPSHHCLRLPF